MRRSALLGTLLLLSGCSGLGKFFGDTVRLPGQNANIVSGSTENLMRAHGREPALDPIMPQSGNVWPGPPQPLPTLGDVSRGGGLESGALTGAGPTLPRGGSMSAGEQNSIRDGAPLDQAGFSGGGGASRGLSGGAPGGASGGGLTAVPDPSRTFHGGGAAPDAGGNIVIPNGDGTSTVISPDGSVKTVKGVPK